MLPAGHAEVSAVPRPAAREAEAPPAVGPETAGARPIRARPDAVHARNIPLGKGNSDRLVDEVNGNVVP
jgi:hypothetical protein